MCEDKKDKNKNDLLDTEKESDDIFDDVIPPSTKNEIAKSRIKKRQPNQTVDNPITMLQLSMPRNDPGNVLEWKVRNGETNLKIRSGIITNEKGLDEPAGLPYDWFPRYMLLWLAHHVMRTGEQEIFLGYSEAQILDKIDKDRQGYLYKDLRKHIPALLNSDLIINYEYPEVNIGNEKAHPYQGKGDHREYRRFATAIDRLGSKNSDNRAFKIVLSNDFYNSIIHSPLPIDMKHVKKLVKGGGSLKVDIYSFLAEKLYKIPVDKPLLVRRHDIEDLFGANTADKGKFYREKFLKKLEVVKKIYTTAKVEEMPKEGIMLHHSPPPYPLEKLEYIAKLPNPSEDK